MKRALVGSVFLVVGVLAFVVIGLLNSNDEASEVSFVPWTGQAEEEWGESLPVSEEAPQEVANLRGETEPRSGNGSGNESGDPPAEGAAYNAEVEVGRASRDVTRQDDPGGDDRQPGPGVASRDSEEEPDGAMGTLAREQVRAGIEAFRPVVRRCYEETLVEFPEAAGRIELEFTIEAADEQGRVSMSEIGEGTDLFEDQLHDCILYHVSEVVFDAPGGGGVVKVRYPFQFLAAESERD